ncbi:hypothetical protein WDV93_13525 [Pantoea ananatis]
MTVVLPSTLMLTTEGITFSSMGARLGNGWLGEDETEEDVSAAKALTGVSAMPRLSARALNINEVFSFWYLTMMDILTIAVVEC